MRFESKITDVHETNNPQFASCRIQVCYTGLNRNNSFLAKEDIENAIPTIFNVPIIGEFIESSNNFGGHGGRIVIDDKGIKFEDTTKPYGVVASDSDVHWEMITGDDDIEREWLVVDSALLWKARYEDDLSSFDDYVMNESMEIEIVDSYYDESKVLHITNFNFSGLCILGVSKSDGDDGNVEPCFEGASISLYAFNQDSFMKKYSMMIEEVKNSSKVEWPSVSGKELKKQVKDNPNSGEFAWTSEQLESELRMLLGTQKYMSDWGYQYSAYWLVDYLPDQNIVIAEDSQNYYLVGMNYAVEGDKVSIDFDSCKRFKIEYVPMELQDNDNLDNSQTFSLLTKEHMEYEVQKRIAEKFAQSKEISDNNTNIIDTGNSVKVDQTLDTPVDPNAITGDDFALELEELKQKNAELEAKNKELEEFKLAKEQEERKVAEEALFAKFAGQFTEDETKELREHASEFSLEDLEMKMFALAGKKAMSGQFSLKDKKDVSNKVPVFSDNKVDTSKPYGGLIEKYATNLE